MRLVPLKRMEINKKKESFVGQKGKSKARIRPKIHCECGYDKDEGEMVYCKDLIGISCAWLTMDPAAAMRVLRCVAALSLLWLHAREASKGRTTFLLSLSSRGYRRVKSGEITKDCTVQARIVDLVQ